MGGRGGSSGFTRRGERNETKAQQNNYKEIALDESHKKLSTSGSAVQQSFIDYVKRQTNINLGKARDPMFDTRRYFNIDTHDLGKNDLSTVKNLVRQYSGGYDVSFETNGAHRVAIFVKRKRK